MILKTKLAKKIVLKMEKNFEEFVSFFIVNLLVGDNFGPCRS